MITLKKLASLAENTRLRKQTKILYELLNPIKKKIKLSEEEEIFLLGLIEQIKNKQEWDTNIQKLAYDCYKLKQPYQEDEIRSLENLYYSMLAHLGYSVADWDLQNSNRYTELITNETEPLPMRLYLDDLRSPFNVGSIMRSASAFGVTSIYTSVHCCSVEHPRVKRTSMGVKIPIYSIDVEDFLKREKDFFILELGGTPIQHFSFPTNACCVIGSEELGVSQTLYHNAKKRGKIVSIPLYGNKHSLNVANSCSILLSYWSHSLSENVKPS